MLIETLANATSFEGGIVIVGEGNKCSDASMESLHAVQFGLATEDGSVIFTSDKDCDEVSSGGITLGVWIDGEPIITGDPEWIDGKPVWSE